MAMSRLRYLTVQDVLWIHLQAARRVVAFDYDRLEEATFCQYSHGDSTCLAAQAVRFGKEFVSKAPFAEANEPAGFLALVALMEMNGWRPLFGDEQGPQVYREIVRGARSAESAFAPGDREGHEQDLEQPDLEQVVCGAMRRYPGTLAALGGAAAA
jgi:hypothetical protein